MAKQTLVLISTIHRRLAHNELRGKKIMIMAKEKIVGRWTEQKSKLFEDHRKDYNVMKHKFASPAFMEDEIQAAIRKMKSGKAKDTDG